MTEMKAWGFYHFNYCIQFRGGELPKVGTTFTFRETDGKTVVSHVLLVCRPQRFALLKSLQEN